MSLSSKILLVHILCYGVWLSACDSQREKPDDGPDTRRRAAVVKVLSGEELERLEDLLGPSPLMDEIVPINADRSAEKTVELVVERIKALRVEKGLALSSSERPAGSRPASELARLLVAPGSVLESDYPTNDIEMTSLAIATLRRHGIETSPAIQIAQGDTDQLEHVVLAVPDAQGKHTYREMTRDELTPHGSFEVISEVELLGLHLARRAALLHLIAKNVDAKKDLDAAFKLAPEMATPYYVRASMSGDIEPALAIKDLSRVSLRKNSPEIWLRLGRAMRLQGNHTGAYHMLERIEEDSAFFDEASVELAQSACEQGDVEQFYLRMLHAVVTDRKRWEAYRDVAIVAIVQGDLETAQGVLQSGVRAAPDVPVWEALSTASQTDPPVWHEGLETRRKMLGRCALERLEIDDRQEPQGEERER